MNVTAPVIVPALTAGMVWLAAGRLWKRPAAPALVWGGSLAVAISFYAGHVALMGRPPIPPVTAVHSLVYAGLIAGIVGIAESLWRSHWAVRWTIRAVLAAGAAWWQFSTLAEHTWSAAQTFGWLTTVTLSVCVLWDAIDRFAMRCTNLLTPLLLWTWACVASAGLVLGASAMLGQLAGCVAATCGAAVVLSLWARRFPLNQGAVGVLVLIVTGLLWQGYFYAELPLTAAALLLATPIAIWIGEVRTADGQRIRGLVLAACAGVLITAGAGLIIAYLEYRATALEVGDYAY